MKREPWQVEQSSRRSPWCAPMRRHVARLPSMRRHVARLPKSCASSRNPRGLTLRQTLARHLVTAPASLPQCVLTVP